MRSNEPEREQEIHTPDPCWPLFLKQLCICFGTVAIYFNYGLFFAAPTVFIPQMRKEANSSTAISMEMESWLSSAVMYSSIPWTIILPITAFHWGRRRPTVILWLFMTFSAIILFFSTSVEGILVSQVIQGVLPATTTISAMILTECTMVKYRGVFMTLKNATLFWGIWASNAIGTFYHWKTIVIIIICICCILSLPILFWPESPYWLASKGRFDECTRMHRWLKGSNTDAEKELNLLLVYFEKQISSRTDEKLSVRKRIFKLGNIIISARFCKQLIYGFLPNSLYIFSGKLTCSVYAVGLIRQMTNSEQAAYIGMLLIDGFNIVGMYVGCALSKVLNRKTLLLSTSILGVTFLFILALYFYVIKLSIITDNKYVSISLLTFFSMAISSGPVILGPCILGELTPLKFRSTYLATSSVIISLAMGITIKISPFVLSSLGLHWTFLLLGFITSLNIYLVYKYVPETKDKTLYDLQLLLNGSDVGSLEERRHMFS